MSRPDEPVPGAARPLELLIVRPTLGAGGADRVTLTLLRHLPRHRFRPTLVLMRQEGELLPEVPSDVPVRALRARSLWTAWLPLALLVRRDRPDILFSTSGGANLAAALAHVLSGRRCRLVLSERGHLRSEMSWKKRLQTFLKYLLYRFADRIAVVSEGVKEELACKLRLPPESISVVYNPIVDERLESLAAKAVNHAWFEAALDESHPVILTVGRMVPEKDHATLLRAFVELRERHDARLVILGNGPLSTDVERDVAAMGVSNVVYLPGYDPNPFKYMARCRLFVLSSRSEGLPGALIQAMACGAPVVSTDCPTGPREIITHEWDGLLAPVGDPASLAEAMERILANRDLRERLAVNARESSRRFSVERSLPLYTNALWEPESRKP